MKAMILAAGFGKRMRPLTETTPKPLLTINDKPLIFYVIEQLAKADIREFVINHAYLGEQIEQRCGKGEFFGVNIQYSAEGQPLETAGGILKALPMLGDQAFIVVNGDVHTNYDFSQLAQHKLGKYLAHLVLVDNPEQHKQGDFSLQAGQLGLAENNRYTYSGISIVHPQLFHQYPQYTGQLAPLLRHAIADGLVSGEYFKGQWHDVGTPERLQALNAVRQS